MKTQYFERKANFPVRKSFWPNLPPTIECDKPKVIVFISSKASVTITLEKLRSFLQGLIGCWKHIFLKERQTLQWRKVFGHFLFLLSSVIDPRGQFLLVQKLVWQLLWKNKIVSSELESLLKTHYFERNENFPVRKVFWPAFLSYIRVWQTSRDSFH